MLYLLVCLFIILVVCHNLRTSHSVFQRQALLDLNIHAVAQSCHHLLALIGFLLTTTLDNIYKGTVATKLDGTLGHGNNIQGLGQNYLCIGMKPLKPLKEKISITIDADILEKIKYEAECDDRSLSQYINLVLKNHINSKNR